MIEMIWKRIKSLSFDRFLLLILFFYICVSHIFLPLSKKKDFLFFYQWALFNCLPMERVYDITWDEGKTFLFRDYSQKVKNTGINIHTLFYLLASEKGIAAINQYFYSDLASFCKCQNIKLFELKGSLSDHIIYKKQLEVQKQTAL